MYGVVQYNTQMQNVIDPLESEWNPKDLSGIKRDIVMSIMQQWLICWTRLIPNQRGLQEEKQIREGVTTIV